MTRHILYRFYNEETELLYIGITNNIGHRLAQHEQEKLWFREIDTIKLEYYGTREELKIAEKHAILNEEPLYNVTHNHAGRQGIPKVLNVGDVLSFTLGTNTMPRATPAADFVITGLVSYSNHVSASVLLYDQEHDRFGPHVRDVHINHIRCLRWVPKPHANPLKSSYYNGRYAPADGLDMAPLIEFRDEYVEAAAAVLGQSK